MKMIKSTLAALVMLVPMLLPAQEFLRLPSAQLERATMIKPFTKRVAPHGKVPTPSVPRSLTFLNQEVILGSTLHDLQSNAAMQNRITVGLDGYKAAVWMFSNSIAEDQPDRGTGFCEYVDGRWSEMPEERLERVGRGWPSLVLLVFGSPNITSNSVGMSIITMNR
jgi:hypothetical protein